MNLTGLQLLRGIHFFHDDLTFSNTPVYKILSICELKVLILRLAEIAEYFLLISFSVSRMVVALKHILHS